MGTMKWAVVVVFGSVALGALGYGLASGPAGAVATKTFIASALELRPFPNRAPAMAGAAAVNKPPVPAAPIADAGVPALPPPPPRAVVDAGVAPRPPAPAPANPSPAPAASSPAPAVAEGTLDLQASEAADVFVDGRKVGSAPVQNLKVKAGTHKVRFDCYDSSGNSTPGQAQTATVRADEPTEITFTCPPVE